MATAMIALAFVAGHVVWIKDIEDRKDSGQLYELSLTRTIKFCVQLHISQICAADMATLPLIHPEYHAAAEVACDNDQTVWIQATGNQGWIATSYTAYCWNAAEHTVMRDSCQQAAFLLWITPQCPSPWDPAGCVPLTDPMQQPPCFVSAPYHHTKHVARISTHSTDKGM